MKLLHFLLFFLFTFSIQAQSSDPAIPRWLIGAEAQVYFQNFDYPGSIFGNYGYGLQLEKPLGQFSVGTGITQQQFGRHRLMEFTGEVGVDEDNNRPLYTYENQYRQIRFWTIPLRLQYRLPCNCVYFQAALNSSFLQNDADLVKENFTEQYYDEPTTVSFFNMNHIRQFSLGYSLGLGLNLHLSEHWKMYTRLIYSQYSFINDSYQRHKALGNTYLGLNAGLQFAIY